jgi:hypothetical protein
MSSLDVKEIISVQKNINKDNKEEFNKISHPLSILYDKFALIPFELNAKLSYLGLQVIPKVCVCCFSSSNGD